MSILNNSLAFIGSIFLMLGLITYMVGKAGKVNPYFGVRFPQTLRNVKLWKKVNIRAGIGFAIHGCVMISIAFMISQIDWKTFFTILLLPLTINIIYSLYVTLKNEGGG
jgi:uncharacterized membrane protein